MATRPPSRRSFQSGSEVEVNGRTDAELAYSSIVNLILAYKLRPGERTSVIQLSERLNLGRTPVKEAITRLQAEGLLSVAGRSGTTVREVTAESARQVFALRRTLESFAVPDAVQLADDRDFERLKRLLLIMGEAGKSDLWSDAASFVRANVEFHSIIVGAARNPSLDRLYAQIQIQAQIVTYLYHRGSDPKAAKQRQLEHTKILKALMARDAVMLDKLLGEHAKTTEEAVLRFVPAKDICSVKPQVGAAVL
jgi:GntR family transcriptional regulator, rspAB operon transcriptional repressor